MVSRDQTQVKRWCQAPLPAEPLVSPGSSFQSDMQRWVAKDTWVFGNRLPTFYAGTLLHLALGLYFAFHEWLDNDLCNLLQSLIQYAQNVPSRCLMNIPIKNFWVYPVFLLYSLSDSSGRCVRHMWAFKIAIHLPVELGRHETRCEFKKKYKFHPHRTFSLWKLAKTEVRGYMGRLSSWQEMITP